MNSPTRKATALLTFLWILASSMLVATFFFIPPANVVLVVQDVSFSTHLADRIATIQSQDQTAQYPIITYQNQYVIPVGKVLSGPIDWKIIVDGFHPQELHTDLTPLAWNAIKLALKPNFGHIHLQVKNAQNPSLPVNDIEVSCQHQTVQGQASNATLEALSPGAHQLTIKAKGFCPTQIVAHVEEGQTTEIETYLSPKLIDREVARIVIHWGEHPEDIDSHLYLPTHPDLDFKHVFFKEKVARLNGQKVAVLDVDDVNSYGPETTTLYGHMDGTYRFLINHYRGSGNLGSSQALIKVTTDGCAEQRFTIPTDCTKKWYYLFDIIVENGKARLVERTSCLNKEQLKSRLQITNIAKK